MGTAYGRALLTKLGLLTLVLALGGISFMLRSRGPSVHLLGAELILALAIFVATGFLTSLPPATAVKQEAPPEDVEVLEVQLDSVGDSVTSGTATFREDMASETAGIVLKLEASGLPEAGPAYFSQIHEGVCKSDQQGRDSGSENAGYGRPASSDMRRFELLSAQKPEYAHRGGHPNADLEFVGSDDGTAVVFSREKDYDTIEKLLSGRPKYIDIHTSSRGDPTIACGDIRLEGSIVR